MLSYRRLARAVVVGFVAVAAIALGSLTLTTPASAAMVQSSSQSSGSDNWTGGAAKDMDSGAWRATITRDGETRVLAGDYATEKEARKAGKAKAKELNKGNVVDAPECEPPVLC